MTTGGDGRIGCKASEETKQKQSKLKQGNLNPFYGKHHSEETKTKLSEAAKLRYTNKKNPFYSKCHTEETKQKISKANTGKTNSIETRAKISKSLKGRSFSEEHRKNLANANKAQCKKVLCVDTGVIYDSLSAAAKINNLNASGLSKACRSNGKIKYGKKYWSYDIN